MAQQYEVTFWPEGKRVTVAEGTTLLAAARQGGVILEAPCDGCGTCGKCRVRTSGMLSSPDELETERLADTLAKGIRLACRARVCGPVQAEILLDRIDTFVALAGGQGAQWPFDPSVRKVIFSSRVDAEGCALDNDAPALFAQADPPMLQELAAAYDKGRSHYGAIVKNARVLDWVQPGQAYYGVAVDLGTTSVVAELCDLDNGESMGTGACLNPQTDCGGDVLTRIAFASQNPEGTALLQKKIVAGLNRLIDQLTAARQLRNEDIYEIVIVGNTTMLHLLLGVNPRSLARAPYRPVFKRYMEISPASLGLYMAPLGVVTILPSAAAFVGADILAGLTAVGLHRRRTTVLFIDIGTNGEIVVCKDGLLVGASSAAGPALEGMNISCGCRAERGAIESVAIAHDGTVRIKTIGNTPPRGLCGSGLIDLVAELVRCKVLEVNGRFAKPEKLPPPLAAKLVKINNQPAFMVAEAGAVYLSQKDVRQVQLAKGAMAAAINLLLQDLNIEFTNITEILVAGAFGFHLKPSSLVGIGLFVADCQHKIRFVGNTAQEGAKAALLNRQAGREIVKIGQRIKIRELSRHPAFQDFFVKALAFPSPL